MSTPAERNLGTLFIVAAPSGGGKTSLVNTLVHRITHIAVSISHTTRPKRPGEVDGEDYFFVSDAAFLEMVNQGQFVEYAQVFKHYYGTSVGQIESRLQSGIDIVLDIDWQGAQQIRHNFADAVGIFVVPPSIKILKERLTQRQQDNQKVINERMECARNEMSHFVEFDYLIVNDDFTKAADELESIVVAHRLSMGRQARKQQKLLSLLLGEQ